MTAAPLSIVVVNIDPVIHLGPLNVHWYGVMYAIAFIAAYRFGVLPLTLRSGISRALAEKITTITIVTGLLGGRFYYDVQQPDFVHTYLLHPINLIAFWNGGMAFFGAIIVGLITLALCAWRYRLNPWLVCDGGVLFAVVGQPIGRIGNIINGDILGAPSSLPWATAYANPHAILQAGFRLCTDTAAPGSAACPAYQPAALYEALGTIVIGLVLLYLYRRHVRAGILAITYVALYAVSQLVIFQFRASEPILALGLHQAQLTAIGMLVIAVPALVLLWRATASRMEAFHAHTPPTAANPATG